MITDEFRLPSETLWLYDQVRSKAVHGERMPEVTRQDVTSFSWDVRRAITQYITLARALGVSKRSKLTTAIDRHPDRHQLIEWLRDHDGETWAAYFAGTEDVPRA